MQKIGSEWARRLSWENYNWFNAKFWENYIFVFSPSKDLLLLALSSSELHSLVVLVLKLGFLVIRRPCVVTCKDNYGNWMIRACL